MSIPSLSEYSATQPEVTAFLQAGLQNNRLAHAFIFKGREIETMYGTALALAQVLNCEDSPSPDAACGVCPSCHWISDNAHPEVITISRLTYLSEEREARQSLNITKEKKSKQSSTATRIKVEQMNALLAHVSLSSAYCRVIIFTDAETVPSSQINPDQINNLNFRMPPAPYEWRQQEKNQNKAFLFKPLERRILDPISANRILKTLEEPPPNTVFIFLTDQAENLIETIVSRCQILPFRNYARDPLQHLPSERLAFYEDLLLSAGSQADPYSLIQTFEKLLDESEGLTDEQFLTAFQRYLQSRFETTALIPDQLQADDFKRYRTMQQQLETAIHQLQAKTHREGALSEFFYRWGKA